MPTCHMPDEGGRARRVQTAQDIRRLQPTFLLGTASLFRPLGAPCPPGQRAPNLCLPDSWVYIEQNNRWIFYYVVETCFEPFESNSKTLPV